VFLGDHRLDLCDSVGGWWVQSEIARESLERDTGDLLWKRFRALETFLVEAVERLEDANRSEWRISGPHGEPCAFAG
jgi:hypothetical protein